MSFTFVQASGTLTYASDNTAGNLLVCLYAWTSLNGSAVTSLSVVDAAGNEWSQIGPLYDGTTNTGDGQRTFFALFIVPKCKAASGNTLTLNAVGGSGTIRKTASIREYSYSGGLPTYDASNFAAELSYNGTTTFDSGNISTVIADELLIGATSQGDGQSAPAPSGWANATRSSSSQTGTDVYDQINVASGIYDFTGAYGGAADWNAGIWSIKLVLTGHIISGNAGAAGATVSYSGTASGSVTADGSGNYSITSLADGSYTVTPSLVGWTFSPVSRNKTVSAADITGVNFTGTQLQVATPTALPNGGFFSTSPQSTTLSCATGGATIHYTTDGSTPTAGSAAYLTALSIVVPSTLKAIAVLSGYLNSAVMTATFSAGNADDTSLPYLGCMSETTDDSSGTAYIGHVRVITAPRAGYPNPYLGKFKKVTSVGGSTDPLLGEVCIVADQPGSGDVYLGHIEET